MPQFRQSLTIELVEGAQFTIEQISYQQQAYYFNAQRFFFNCKQNKLDSLDWNNDLFVPRWT